MTRDEAIEKLKAVTNAEHSRNWEEVFLERCVALGMLKLDEPPTLDEEINLAINTYLFTAPNKCAGGVKSALDRAGLKIVKANSAPPDR